MSFRLITGAAFGHVGGTPPEVQNQKRDAVGNSAHMNFPDFRAISGDSEQITLARIAAQSITGHYTRQAVTLVAWPPPGREQVPVRRRAL